MRTNKFLPFMVMVPWTVGQIDLSAPGCAIRCWENTQYVSKCLGDSACLCSDPNYRNSVFQCLYSQCDTAHFGPAVHHAISGCRDMSSNQPFLGISLAPNRAELRRREAEYAAGEKLAGSGSAVGYPTGSADNYPTQSVNYPTQSAQYPTKSAASATPTAIPYFPLNTVRSTAASAQFTSPPVSYDALPASTTAPSPQVFSGLSSKTITLDKITFLIALVVIYVCL